MIAGSISTFGGVFSPFCFRIVSHAIYDEKVRYLSQVDGERLEENISGRSVSRQEVGVHGNMVELGELNSSIFQQSLSQLLPPVEMN